MTDKPDNKKQNQVSMPSLKKEKTKPDSYELTLDEACARLSKNDSRVELISSFHSEETKVGKLKDFEGNYFVRFTAFAKRPVK